MIFEWVWILFCYMLFPDQKYRSGVAGFHLLIQEQPFYDQSTSPCKSVRLNGEYRCLQLLLPQNTYHKYILKSICQEIKPKGDETGQTKTIQKEEVMLQKKWGAKIFTGCCKSPCCHQVKWDCENYLLRIAI